MDWLDLVEFVIENAWWACVVFFVVLVVILFIYEMLHDNDPGHMDD